MGRKSRGRTEALLTIRVTAEELEALKAHAQSVGASMSEWARSRLFAALVAEGGAPPVEPDATAESSRSG